MSKNISEQASDAGIEIFSTCPQSTQIDSQSYIRQVSEVAKWSEESGCKGILVYTDNSLVDPWLVSQIIIESTTRLCPLIAVQPMYMHPYTAAKMVASLGYVHNRRTYLNMLAGGFINDLAALGDDTAHARRYNRAVEYALIIKQLLSSNNPVSFSGEFYRVENLRMTPSLPQELFPGILISGSSEDGIAAAKAIGATAVKYPKPACEYNCQTLDNDLNTGIRVGIIAREDSNTAWQIAHTRFPEDRKGQITHQLAMKVSDSIWHKQLSDIGEPLVKEKTPYWLGPFQNYKTFCPYLVGNYQSVAEEISGYMRAGHKTFILDIPPSFEELSHINIVFKEAIAQASASASAATAD